MRACLRRQGDKALVFADVGQVSGGIVFEGRHSHLIKVAKGLHAGWIARTRVLIVGNPKASDEERRIAREIVGRCGYFHQEIVVGDRRGVDETVVRECNRLGMRYQTFGTTVRPLNGGKHYTHVLTVPGLSAMERDAARLRFMVSEADIIYLIGVCLEGVSLRGKDVIDPCTARPLT
jgi:hypothetical protein